jgi:meso-butanediol dehydrogenase/(S,S)-butanediol dehydrogenase/diacetyl reductase
VAAATGQTFVEASVDDWRATLDVNLTGPFLLARAALPQLLERQGSVVSVASVAAFRAGPGMAAYCASKAGLVLLTQRPSSGCSRRRPRTSTAPC